MFLYHHNSKLVQYLGLLLADWLEDDARRRCLREAITTSLLGVGSAQANLAARLFGFGLSGSIRVINKVVGSKAKHINMTLASGGALFKQKSATGLHVRARVGS